MAITSVSKQVTIPECSWLRPEEPPVCCRPDCPEPTLQSSNISRFVLVANNPAVDNNGAVNGPHDYQPPAPPPPSRREAVEAMQKICGRRICGGIDEKKK